MAFRQEIKAYATPEENDRFKSLRTSNEKVLQHTSSSLEMELIEQRRQNSMLTFKIKDLELTLRHQQDIIEQLEQQISAQLDKQIASEQSADTSHREEEKIPDVNVEDLILLKERELLSGYKRKIKELKQRHAKKIDSLKDRYDEVLQYIKTQEKEEYEEKLKNYRDKHTEENVRYLETSLADMGKKFFDMRGYAKELERKLDIAESGNTSGRIKELEDRNKKLEERIKEMEERRK